MAVPNYQAQVAEAARKYPDAWKNAHTGNAQTEDFIRLLASDLHALDQRCGLNGKRGNPNDISDDVIAIKGEGVAVDVVNGGPMAIIDIIANAGAPNASPAWQVDPAGPGDKGAWVKPGVVVPGGGTKPVDPEKPPVPKKPPYPGDAVGGEIGTLIWADYEAAGRPVHPGVAIWVWRCAWDCANEGLTAAQSVAKHRAEWRAEIGLP